MSEPLRALLLALGLFALTAAATPPTVSNVTMAVRCADPTMVDITFTLADDEGDSCWIFPFGHNPTTREYVPMTCFAVPPDGTLKTLGDMRFPPGTHTITWLPGGDWGTRNDFGSIVAYVRASDTGRIAPGRFLVIDLSAGSGAEAVYPYEYRTFVDVRQEVYRTSKLVLRELPDGSWAGVHEVTQEQYLRVTGLSPSKWPYPMRPVEQVS